MDSQGYRGHRGDEDPGKGPEKVVKPAKAKDVAKDAEKVLNKVMDDMKTVSQYVNDQGILVTVYPEKKVKRSRWMRGEALYGMKMRIPEDGDRCFVQFTRKNGKY